MKTNDEIRKEHLSRLAVAFEKYHNITGTYKITNAGWNDTGNGFINENNTSAYERSILDVLYDGGYISRSSEFENPSGKPYLYYVCASGSKFALFTKLDSVTSADTAKFDKACNSVVVGSKGNYAVVGE